MKSKLNIDLIVVGNLKEKSLKSLSDEYAKRMTAYSKLEIKELIILIISFVFLKDNPPLKFLYSGFKLWYLSSFHS